MPHPLSTHFSPLVRFLRWTYLTLDFTLMTFSLCWYLWMWTDLCFCSWTVTTFQSTALGTLLSLVHFPGLRMMTILPRVSRSWAVMLTSSSLSVASYGYESAYHRSREGLTIEANTRDFCNELPSSCASYSTSTTRGSMSCLSQTDLSISWLSISQSTE